MHQPSPRPARGPFARRVLGSSLLLAVVVSVAACGPAATEPRATPAVDLAPLECAVPDGPVVIAASARSNSPAPKVTAKMATVLDGVIAAQGHITILDTDQAPSVVDEATIELRSKNDLAAAREVAARHTSLIEAVASSRADEPEADPLAALDMAARTVHARAGSGTVVLVDSGVQTSGALRYQASDLLMATGPDLVAHLRSTDQLPDLSGVTVVLAGLGDTVAPQDKLDAATRSRLVEQWSAIAAAAGAACVEVDTEPLTEPTPPEAPPVTTVAAPEAVQPQLQVRRPVALREDTVGFQDDSDQLRDPAAAKSALAPLAREISEGEFKVTLTGTTASAGTEEGRRTLSLLRAEAVKALLVDLGVPSRAITARGVGINHPRHVDDLDAYGNLIPSAAIKNRAVFVQVRG